MAVTKILLVEDDIYLQELVKMRLESNNFEVSVAGDGKEGVLKAMSEKPDLILADLLMPEMDGIEMIKVIRSNSDLKEVPIIVVSALGRDQDIEKAIEAGANEYITKPYTPEDLIKRISKY